MKTINHDPKEKRPKASLASVLTTSVILGGGLALYRADWEALAASDESPLQAIAFVAAIGLGVIAVTWAILKAWDWLAAKIKGA